MKLLKCSCVRRVYSEEKSICSFYALLIFHVAFAAYFVITFVAVKCHTKINNAFTVCFAFFSFHTLCMFERMVVLIKKPNKFQTVGISIFSCFANRLNSAMKQRYSEFMSTMQFHSRFLCLCIYMERKATLNIKYSVINTLKNLLWGDKSIKNNEHWLDIGRAMTPPSTEAYELKNHKRIII